MKKVKRRSEWKSGPIRCSSSIEWVTHASRSFTSALAVLLFLDVFFPFRPGRERNVRVHGGRLLPCFWPHVLAWSVENATSSTHLQRPFPSLCFKLSQRTSAVLVSRCSRHYSGPTWSHVVSIDRSHRDDAFLAYKRVRYQIIFLSGSAFTG